MSYTPKFPKNPSDNTEVLDRYGNRWQFDAASNAWVSKGVIKSYTTVTEDSSGLVTPEVYTKLQNLRTYSQIYDLKKSLKIAPATNAYWYYFRSSDKLIKFKPESSSTLRIEIDRGRLYQILLKNQRVGPPGSRGDSGDPGLDGLPGASVCDTAVGEPDYEPSLLDNDRLDFAIYTPTPLVKDGPIPLPNEHIPSIAVRLYKITDGTNAVLSDQLKTFDGLYPKAFGAHNYEYTRKLVAESVLGSKQNALCNISLSRVYKVSPLTIAYPAVTIDIDPITREVVSIKGSSQVAIDQKRTLDSIKFDSSTNIVCGSIFIASGKWQPNQWTVRSRQRGPDGDVGDDGEARITIETNSIDNSNVEAVCPIVNVRYDQNRQVIHTLCNNLSSEVCVGKISVLSGMGTLASGPILSSKFAAVQMILDECKYVNLFKPELQPYTLPSLELDAWEPQPGCVTQRHYDRHKFDWFTKVKGSACSPFGVYNEYDPTKFPYNVITAGTPPEDECCQEDWFYCPNVQDGPCEGEPPAPPPTKFYCVSSGPDGSCYPPSCVEWNGEGDPPWSPECSYTGPFETQEECSEACVPPPPPPPNLKYYCVTCPSEHIGCIAWDGEGDQPWPEECSALGPYDTEAECSEVCEPPVPGYYCVGEAVPGSGVCYPPFCVYWNGILPPPFFDCSASGPFQTESECLEVCSPVQMAAGKFLDIHDLKKNTTNINRQINIGLRKWTVKS